MTYDDEDSSSSDEDAPRKKGGKEMYNPVKASVKYLKLVETQTIQLDSGNPKDIIMIMNKLKLRKLNRDEVVASLLKGDLNTALVRRKI